MKIKTYRVIRLSYEVWLEGDLVEKPQPLTVLTHFAPELPKGLEEAILGKTEGEYRVSLSPYGAYNPALREEVPIADLPEPPRLGGGYAADNDLLYRVVEINEKTTVLDANHPWAGKVLEYRYTIYDSRPAEPDEIAHGHVHGEGGINH